MSDGLGDLVNRLIARRLQSEEWGSAGTILAYDAARHTAKARLHPAERDTGWLRLLTLPGVVLAPTPGAPCYVLLQRGVPAMIAGVAYSDQPVYPHSPPAPGLALDQHSISVQSLSVGGPITLTPRATLPALTGVGAARGQVALLGPAYSSASGDVPDTLWVTVQDATGALAWRQVLTTPQLGLPLFAASLDANTHVLQQAVRDATEAATNDTLSASSTIVNNLNRLRYQLSQAGLGAWNAIVAAIPLSQKGAASGVAALDGSSRLLATATAGALTVNGTETVAGHVLNTGSAPTLTAGAGAGTGATVGWFSATGTDRRGVVQVNTGAGASFGSRQALITFATAYATPPAVILSGAGAVASDTITTTGFEVWWNTGVNPPSSSAYRFSYLVEG